MPTETLSPPSSPSLAAYRLHALTISKLSKSDHQSALKYAICAHEVDPTLPHLPLIIKALKVLLSPPLDHYQTLLLPPFSSSSRIRSQFKTLSLTFKNPDLDFDGLNDAIRRIEESYQVLSDRELKKEFDDSLRRLEAEKDVAGDVVPLQVLIPKSGTVRKSKQNSKKRSDDDDEDYYDEENDDDDDYYDEENEVVDAGSRLESKTFKDRKRVAVEDFDFEEEDYDSNNRLRSKRIGVRKRYSDEEFEYQEEYNNTDQRSSRKLKIGKEKTLAQMQMEIFNAKKRNKKSLIAISNKDEVISSMKVIDSDFYEFDNDRNEKSFVKGQIWAVYDGDDGMPRHYGLVEDVKTINSFKVIIRWLEITRKDKKGLVLFDDLGYYDTCGTYRLGSKVDMCCINMFSHLVQSERMGKEVYRIYPRKGSVWAFYRNVAEKEEGRIYDIVVCLTNYSEMYGLSVAYLEKVDGYKTMFTRKAIGLHAITWLEKVNGHMFSHQIPSRKLLGHEDENLPGECWELDPASLPAELLCISNGN